jgi:UDP-N-acetylmuramyl tripeptide synthase
VVIIDEPKGVSWGGYNAGPVFKNIAWQALSLLGVPPDEPPRVADKKPKRRRAHETVGRNTHGAGQRPPPFAISGIAVDSRSVKPGTLFVAIKGVHQDGHAHAEEAARAGAVAIVAEHAVPVPIPVVVVPSTAAALSGMAARFFDFPSKSMDVVGITGTNGKTTITYLLENIWRGDKRPGRRYGHHRLPLERPCGKSPEHHPPRPGRSTLLSAMGAAGVKRVAMEVSSHALALGRVEDVDFSVGVFTNLTQDHLDFHKDMEGYFNAKARLFEFFNGLPARCAGRSSTGTIPGPRGF